MQVLWQRGMPSSSNLWLCLGFTTHILSRLQGLRNPCWFVYKSSLHASSSSLQVACHLKPLTGLIYTAKVLQSLQRWYLDVPLDSASSAVEDRSIIADAWTLTTESIMMGPDHHVHNCIGVQIEHDSSELQRSRDRIPLQTKCFYKTQTHQDQFFLKRSSRACISHIVWVFGPSTQLSWEGGGRPAKSKTAVRRLESPYLGTPSCGLLFLSRYAIAVIFLVVVVWSDQADLHSFKQL